MDTNLRSFMRLSHFIALLMAAAVLVLYNSFIIRVGSHYRIFLYLGSILLLLTLFFLCAAYAIRYIYIGNAAGRASLLLSRLGKVVFLPVVMLLAGILKIDKDRIRNIYIKVNNVLLQASGHVCEPGRLLLLIPHCMQNKDCGSKVTEDIRNCKRCGGCRIGDLAALTEEFGINSIVAKGGTAARTAVGTCRPEMIVAVACERELISGISDIGRIPVIGVINTRPNGFCSNTSVDVEELRSQLQKATGMAIQGII